ncbi:MAG TPA: aldo/keto reductase, partial [Acidimicrobiales bacterium]|nr:aldo/keto reductase [Acidimicrobiales bacterium]
YDSALECMEVARHAGVNLFDNAESYAGGESEKVMGAILAKLAWPRHSYVLTTKLFWGLHDETNMRNTLNRKYLMQAVDGSLERLGVSFVDILYCHRSDPNTPIEETVWAMSDIVASGRALYWGTSEWPAADIWAAAELAERHHLRRPVVEQPQYNLLARDKVEREYARLYDDVGLGITSFSPLASGLLTGKYLSGMPAGSRGTLPGYEWLHDRLLDPDNATKARELQTLATSVGCEMSQLAIAWCLRNPHVSSVILGASKASQLRANLGALDVVPLVTGELAERLDAISPPQ